MHPFILYLLKSIAISGLLFAYYLLALKDKKLHVFNRCYLFMAIAASLLVPLITISSLNTRQPQASKVATVLSVIRSGGEEEQILQPTTASWQPRLAPVGIILFFTVSFLLLLRLAVQVAKVYRLKRQYPVSVKNGVPMVLTNMPEAPFSFMGTIYWRQDLLQHTAEGLQMLQHELTHIRQKHSYDKLLSQVVSALFWVNPFFRIIGSELEMVHEYLADEQCVSNQDTQSFAQMLLSAHLPQALLHTPHSFFHSPIKRRLTMLQKPVNVSFARGRMLLALPLLAAAVFLFSFSRKNKPLAASEKIVLVIDAGHGGKDAGASYNNLVEKDLNLRIASTLRRLAAQQGIEVHLTREGDNYPTLQERVSIANSIHPDAFISVHVNSPAVPGKERLKEYEVLVSEKNKQFEESKKLGAAVIAQLSPLGIRIPELSKKGIWVLKDNQAPAILIECGDITNKQETDLLQSDRELEDFCTAILNGVVAWRTR